MATTPILTLCDQLVTNLKTRWAPSGDDDAIRAYFAQITNETLNTLVGRKVWILPISDVLDAEDRGEDHHDYKVAVVTAEEFIDAGSPPNSWLDTRMDWVDTFIVHGFYFLRPPYLSFGGRLVQTRAPVEQTLLDTRHLSTKKLFLSRVEFEFVEIQGA